MTLHVSKPEGAPAPSPVRASPPHRRVAAAIIRHANAEEARKFLRLCCVSATVNGCGYLLYLALAYAGLDPKVAATITFGVSVTVAFAMNRRWTFRDPTAWRRSLPRYVISYLVAYGLNIGGLYVFVDLLHYPHELVQIALMVTIAMLLYFALRFWIFAGGAGKA